jgi:hypothetical protein
MVLQAVMERRLAVPTIFFKKQQLGKWRRSDGESTVHVNEESMHREVQKLVNDGWKVELHGVTHIRAIEVTK